MTFKPKTTAQKLAECKEKNRKLWERLGNIRTARWYKIANAEYKTKIAQEKAKETKRKYRTAFKEVEKSVEHIVKDEVFSENSKLKHIEIIIRTIVAYRKLESEGIVAFTELAFLLIGSQLEYFTIAQAEKRFGGLGWFRKRDLNLLIEAGLFQKVEKKQYYYITVEGKARLDAILNHIYSQKGNGQYLLRGK